MRACKLRVVIPESHEVTLRLPAELPAGDAEVIVLTNRHRDQEPTGFNEWLDEWIRSSPDSPPVPLEVLRREHLYE